MSTIPSDSLYLCLDQGGHASRALVFDSRGAERVHVLREVEVRAPRLDWVEQDPEEIVDSLCTVADKAIAALGRDAHALAAAGLATQRASLVCWDQKTGAALSPVISWQDRRAHEWLRELTPHEEAIHQRTGLRLSAHYGASKFRWCLDHLPAVADAHRARRLAVGPLASFLLFRLLEERPLLIDPANAARTLLWSLHTLDWDPWLLSLFGIPEEILPMCVPTRHDFGTLSVNRSRVPLRIVTGDQSAALLAFGQPTADTGYINIGTGAFLQRAFPDRREAPGLLSSVVYRDSDQSLYVLEGTVNGAGAVLAWAEREWDLRDLAVRLPEWLSRDTDVPLFLNGVAGLGAPFWMAEFPSRLIGDGDVGQKVVAVVESIVFLLHANFEILQPIAPKLRRLVVTGGLARLDGLCQRLADLCGVPVFRPTELEATARGTAYLLADRPEGWIGMSDARSFKPSVNKALRHRYQLWYQTLVDELKLSQTP